MGVSQMKRSMSMIEIGDCMVMNFAATLPDGFYKPLKSTVITMETAKKEGTCESS